jgi:glycerol-3-phosphate cytidylyltransferase
MKKKSIGYTAGVYDMFHVGHLNLLKAAKSQCDYLVVGVNSDDATYKYKQKYPVINENDRLAIVDAIKYVDEVTLVTNTDKVYAYETFRPDVIIVGDDHKNEQKWIDLDQYLRERKSKVIYVPYTQYVSSTILRPIEVNKVGE